MSNPTYALGIDLGTTNCALAEVSLAETGAALSETVTIPQWVDSGQIEERETLPSFLYRPLASQRSAFSAGPGMIDDWVVGEAARVQTARTPGRVVLSAKSWLASYTAELDKTWLPWKSDPLEARELITPLAASAAYLQHLRGAWEARHPEVPFAEQSITITVPASFDVAAQQATLDAAQRAGFPPAVRLLEEPQAAFYSWLENGDSQAQASLPATGAHILVVDVGGGTSDFSLFQLGEETSPDGVPQIKRVAVSQHILLGGDNIDLALAHFLEAQLLPGGEQFEGEVWNHLVARAREVKESSLANQDNAQLRVAVPGRGAGLLAGTLAIEVSSSEIREIVLDGFFPACRRETLPRPGQSGLQEWGLPYAADFAVTRYLADFLREHPPVDAVLFNGGTLAAPVLRDRLTEQIASWQAGAKPTILDHSACDSAVAHGAAHYGAVLAGRGRRIEAGLARAVFLGVAGAGKEPDLLCVLPRGAAPESVLRVEVPGLRVRLNTRVHFRAFQGSHARDEAAGTILRWEAADFHELPPLVAKLECPDNTSETIPVTLEASLNELGLLQVELVGADRRWPLAFNLRAAPEAGSAPTAAPAVAESAPADLASEVDPADEAQIAAALQPLRRVSKPRRGKKGKKLTAGRILRALEVGLDQPRFEWPLVRVRCLADQILADGGACAGSAEQLEAWLYLVGWGLRPGFGAAGDAARMEQLWELASPVTFSTTKRTEAPFSLCWRRVAGGIPAKNQMALFDARIDLWSDARRASPEGVRLAGALERLDLERKERLFHVLLDCAEERAKTNTHPAPYLASLGGLLNRVPLLSSGAVILPPRFVEEAFNRLAPFDWSAPHMANVLPLFMQAARQVKTKEQNLSPRFSRRIVDRLSQAGVGPARLVALREYVPLAAQENAARYEDALPVGLVLDF